jgi:hypothetical protein
MGWQVNRLSPVVKKKRYFAPKRTRRSRAAALPGNQSFRDRGVASTQKVSEDIAPRVGSSRWFPGELLNEAGGHSRSRALTQTFRPVVKTTVTSPRKRVVAGSNPATGFMPV